MMWWTRARSDADSRTVNAEYNNKVAVLVGDFILSTALLQVNYTRSHAIVEELSELGLHAGQRARFSS